MTRTSRLPAQTSLRPAPGAQSFGTLSERGMCACAARRSEHVGALALRRGTQAQVQVAFCFGLFRRRRCCARAPGTQVLCGPDSVNLVVHSHLIEVRARVPHATREILPTRWVKLPVHIPETSVSPLQNPSGMHFMLGYLHQVSAYAGTHSTLCYHVTSPYVGYGNHTTCFSAAPASVT